MGRIRRGTAWLGQNIAAAGLGAFLAAAGCVLLWISGGSGWYPVKAMRNELPSLALLFTLSLLVSGFCGMSAALSAVLVRERGGGLCGTGAFCAFGWTAAAWLFGLGWYAVFFCTRMSVFGAFLLGAALLSAGIAGFVLIRSRAPFPVWCALIPASLGDLYFLILTLEAV